MNKNNLLSIKNLTISLEGRPNTSPIVQDLNFEVNAGENSYLNPVGKQIQRHCLDLGVYLRPLGNVVYLLPPLGISDSQLQRCYAALEQAIDALA